MDPVVLSRGGNWVFILAIVCYDKTNADEYINGLQFITDSDKQLIRRVSATVTF